MASKSRKKKSSRQTKKAKEAFVINEIIIWATLAVSIFVLISYFGFGGTIGDAVAALFMEAFGAAAYLMPFLLFGSVAFCISNQHNKIAYIKTGAAVVFFGLLCCMFEMFSKAGGAVGESLAGIMVPSFGVIGTYVVLIILMIICLVIITGKSALQEVKKQSNKAYDRAKANNVRRKESAKERQEKRKRQSEEKESKLTGKKRRDRYVEGVSFQTQLLKKSPEVRELSADEGEDSLHTGHREPELVINRTVMPDSVEAETLPDPFETEEKEFYTEKEISEKRSMSKETDRNSEVGKIEDLPERTEKKRQKPYRIPPMSLLTRGKKGNGDSDDQLRETAGKLQETLHNFGVNVTVTNVSCGPSVTRYEIQPEQGVKVSKIVGLADDIKLNLAAPDIRIEAPIPGKAAVGIEVPNKENSIVMLRDLLDSAEFKKSRSKISFAVGRDIAGKVVVADISKMPHLLVAGATGSGKSVCINTLVMSILYKATAEEVRLIMIDPKVVELSIYNGIPHLLIPVVTDPKKAAGALNWAVTEMNRRYQRFATQHVRDIKSYNEKVANMEPDENGAVPDKMPQIVIIVDELADLMMVAPGDVEESICRLAQLARAAGIHLVLATQRPSVNVITGLIKANMPSRIAFSVSSGVDSRTIIDMNGAEKLLGKGDMLFYPSGYQKPVRVQGAYVSDQEVQKVVEFLVDHNENASYSEEIEEHINSGVIKTAAEAGEDSGDDRDVYFFDAGKLIIEKEKASIGMLQRSFKIGFNRAARIMDQLCEAGVVGPEEGTKPRKVLISMEEFQRYMEKS